MIQAKTIYQKIWEKHVVGVLPDEEALMYVDLHLLHEINTPQAFDGLKDKQLTVRRPERTLATEDHNVPTHHLVDLDKDSETWTQIRLLRENCLNHGIEHMTLGGKGQGITHVIAPEQGRVQPGMTVVCCDSHTTTHGALGSLAFGIGTSQVEHVLATQTLRAIPFKTMCIDIQGALPTFVDAKDLALYIIRQIGTGGGQGCVIEYRGQVISDMSIEQRMSLCNMTVEAGASAGIISPDQKTVEYVRAALNKRNHEVSSQQISDWLAFATDEGAEFDRVVLIDATKVKKMVTWGTNPAQSIMFGEKVPNPKQITDLSQRTAAEQALNYMGIESGICLSSLKITHVFVGSCTNGRIEDLRKVAHLLEGQQVHSDVHMLIVPGSMAVHEQVLAEGLDKVFYDSGADYRALSGCSLCVGLNADKLTSGKRTLSTSNRNFEGRQGPGVRTHIASPAVAAVSAIHGRIVFS
ncbi:3-isopropylmalate dehydratase large subunit [Photobacterium leiognathi subsp. mandapamensis]|uniref:3-isopropylmalate dehydratase large subunit n=1 Tax=Photobacterium leiognathi TaxID=553611 RepID=UPI003AF3498C